MPIVSWLSSTRSNSTTRHPRGLLAALLLAVLLAGWVTPRAISAGERTKTHRSARRSAVARPVMSEPASAAPGGMTTLTRVLAPVAVQATAPSNIKVGLLASDDASSVKDGLAATGLLASNNITIINQYNNRATPTLSQLQAFDAVLVWTNYDFSDPVATGNVLADYVDSGGGVILATFAFYSGYAILGRIMNSGYSPFQPPSPTSSNGVLDMSTAQTSHPIFDGVPSANYSAGYSANPPLNTDAILLARDTAGKKIIATNSIGTVVGICIFPGYDATPSNPNVSRLFANALIFVSTGGFGISTPRFVSTTPITLTGTAADTTIKKIKVQVRTNPFVDALLDTVARTFSLANVSLNPDSNQVVAQGFTAGDSLVAADTTVIILDQTPPIVHITSPAGGDTLQTSYSVDVTVQGTVREKYLDRVMVRVKQVSGIALDSTLATLTSDTTFTAMVTLRYSGRTIIVAEARDRAGQTTRDSVTVIVFSPNLVDGEGFLYDISRHNGEIYGGGNLIMDTYSTYDDWGELRIFFNNTDEYYYNPTDTIAYADNGRTLIFPPATMSNGLVVSRKVYVPETSFLRYLTVFTNPMSYPITVNFALQGYLDNDSFTRATSRGGSSVNAANDLWFVTDDDYSDTDTGNPPAVAHVFDGLGGIDKADSIAFEEDNDYLEIFWNNVTIDPGQTVAYLHVEAQRTLPAGAVVAARQLAGLPAKLYSGLTSAEIAALRNFPTAPDSAIGDVSGNRQVTAFDASLVLRDLTELITLTPLQRIAGDVSGNGEMSAYDASLILQFVSRTISTFPIRQTTPKLIAASTIFDEIPPLTVAPGGLVTVPIHIRKPVNLAATDFAVKYDPTVLEFVKVIPSVLTDGWDIASNNKNGIVRVAMAGARPLGGEGNLVAVVFRARGPEGTTGAVTVTGLRLNEARLPDFQVPLRIGNKAAIPTTFALGQNRPNPFNPTTTITYALPKPIPVRLVLYNVLGQVVRVLVDEPHPAGFYSVVWDGRDGQGRGVASGVYFYRIEAGEFRQTKRLTLLK